MTAYLLRRIVQIIPTFIGATLLAFIIIQLSPGDFLTQLELDPKFTPETIARFRQQFGLSEPIWLQYLIWMKNLITGNLGYSFAYQAPVLEIIWPRILNSLVLVGLATVFLYLVAIPAGVFGATRQYTLGDQVVSFFSYIGLAVPSFFFALIIIFVLLQLKFHFQVLPFPIGGMTSSNYDSLTAWGKVGNVLWHAVLPAFVIVTADIAGLARVMRGQMLEVLSQDFVRTARSKGLADRKVIYKHAFRNAIIPFIATIGGLLPGLIGGAGLVEVVMNWPGITPLLLDAVGQKDIYVIVGFLTLTTGLLMIGNVLGDLLLAVVDPRIRYN